LYTWEAAKTACPRGWHLPSRDEWDHLAESVGGRKDSDYGMYHDWMDVGKTLKSKSGWYDNGNGTNEYGFSALPGGGRQIFDGTFFNADRLGCWWTATETDAGNSYARGMVYSDDNVYEFNGYKSAGLSVRCVMDN